MRLFRHPLLCNYYLTYRCNARCGFCDIWEKPSPYVNLESFRNNLRDLKKLKVRVIDFTGGEPLLHRELPEFLALAKEMGFITTVTTNCLLYPRYGRELAGKIDMLHFSLDSADKDKHNKSRGVDCFDRVMESIDLAREWGEKPDILFTVNEENFTEISRIYHEISRPNGLILILNPIFSYNKVGSSLGKETMESLRNWAKVPGIYLNEAFLDLRLAGGNSISNPVCRAGSSTVVISPENKLVLPCYHLGKEELEINDQLYELVNSKKVQAEIRQEGRLPECEGCVVNCYMEPSFSQEISPWFFRSLGSTLKYSLEKWIYA
ncbi:MAG: radical SAM protein [Bacteroidia bacterium]|nr:radical SAM protein [Bacteroidia bacterium]